MDVSNVGQDPGKIISLSKEELQDIQWNGHSLQRSHSEGVVAIDIKEKLAQPIPQARTALRNVRGFVPLRDQVMVRRLAEDEMTLLDTLWIPEVGKEKPMVGVVLAVGRGRMDAAGVFHACEVGPNDIVLFGRYSGTEHKINGETVLVMSEGQITGILR